MALIAFLVEKTGEVDERIAIELLEVASRKREPGGFKAALIVYGSRALPIVDPVNNWSVIPEAYSETPQLGRSPDLVEALREALELVQTLENPLEPVQIITVWSASVRPGREAGLIIENLEALGVKINIVVTRPSPPGWIKYYPIIAGKIVTVRSNTNVERLYEKLTGHPPQRFL